MTKIYWCRYCGKPHADQDTRDEHEETCFTERTLEAVEADRQVNDQLHREAFQDGHNCHHSGCADD